tara:strand:+ start:686 stop:1141 length:456 start_codon:yes stop_codon:yes gene_type:complete
VSLLKKPHDTLISNDLKFKNDIEKPSDKTALDIGTIEIKDTNILLAENCYRPTKTWEKIRGLIGRPKLDASSAILLDESDCIHTFFMKYSVDILYLDREFKVIRTIRSMKPWRIAFCLEAFAILVLTSGSIHKKHLTISHQLTWTFKQKIW